MMETSLPSFSPQTLLLAGVTILVEAGILAFSITLFVIHRKRIREFWAPGIIFGALCFLFNVPLSIAVIATMDVSSLMPYGYGFISGMTGFVKTLAIAITCVMGVFGVGTKMFHYVIASAEWDLIKPRPFPILMRTGEKAWGKIGIAALAGAAYAVISMVAGSLLKVGVNDILESGMNLAAGFESLPDALQLALMLLFVASAAIGEEVLFRGALLGFLERLSRNKTAWIAVSIVSVSLLWAFLHVFNTDNPAFKMAQIFLFGCLLSELTRRWSLESAIAAHVSLNVTVVFLAQTAAFAA